jgi:hypothetical protein
MNRQWNWHSKPTSSSNSNTAAGVSKRQSAAQTQQAGTDCHQHEWYAAAELTQSLTETLLSILSIACSICLSYCAACCTIKLGHSYSQHLGTGT